MIRTGNSGGGWWPHMGLGTRRVLSLAGLPGSSLMGAAVSSVSPKWGRSRVESLRQLCSLRKYLVGTSRCQTLGVLPRDTAQSPCAYEAESRVESRWSGEVTGTHSVAWITFVPDRTGRRKVGETPGPQWVARKTVMTKWGGAFDHRMSEVKEQGPQTPSAIGGRDSQPGQTWTRREERK